MSDTVRVGFIGAGNRANASHYPSVADLPDLAEMAAVCDLDEQKLKATADRWGIRRRFTDLHEMLDAVELDAVYCIGPPTVLPRMVMPCLRAGRHVFTEKPLGVSSEDARMMADAAADNECLTMVAFNRRFAPINRHCMKLVEERGGPTQVIVEYHKPSQQVPHDGLSMMVYDISHAVDATRWWLGEPQEIQATVRTGRSDEGTIYNALMSYDSDAVGILTANRDSGTRYERVEVHGPGIICSIFAPDYAEVFVDGAKEPETITGEDLAGTDDVRVTYGFLAENRHFLEAVRDRVQPQPSFEDAAQTMWLCERLQDGDF